MLDAMQWRWFLFVIVPAVAASVYFSPHVNPGVSADTAWAYGWAGGILMGWIVHGVLRFMLHSGENFSVPPKESEDG